VLAEDETDLLLFPPLRSAWAKRGQQAQVSLTGRNARRVLFGALNLRTGHRVFMVRIKQQAGDFCAFLEHIAHSYAGRHVALLLDGDPSHTAARSQRRAAQFGITMLWLPVRSPELNPMDHLWRSAKQNVSANRQYVNIDLQAERVIRYLSRLTPRAALRKAGVLSRHFWLKHALSKNFPRPT
jgi:hypothetical protein